jgi:hypothetical protein
VLAFERWVVRRLLDGKHRLLVPDGGLSIYSRSADRNAASLIARIVDRPDVTAGQIYQCADDEQYSIYQWTQLIGAALGVEPEIVSVPLDLARPVWPLLPTGALASRHTLFDITKARQQLGYRDVVRPVEALNELVVFLASDPDQTASVDLDDAEELAVIDAFDQLRAELPQQLGWDDTEEPNPRWHKYDHPTEPAETRPG